MDTTNHTDFLRGREMTAAELGPPALKALYMGPGFPNNGAELIIYVMTQKGDGHLAEAQAILDDLVTTCTSLERDDDAITMADINKHVGRFLVDINWLAHSVGLIDFATACSWTLDEWTKAKEMAAFTTALAAQLEYLEQISLSDEFLGWLETILRLSKARLKELQLDETIASLGTLPDSVSETDWRQVLVNKHIGQAAPYNGLKLLELCLKNDQSADGIRQKARLDELTTVIRRGIPFKDRANFTPLGVAALPALDALVQEVLGNYGFSQFLATCLIPAGTWNDADKLNKALSEMPIKIAQLRDSQLVACYQEAYDAGMNRWHDLNGSGGSTKVTYT